jgi:L-threonylcarbamoyladenylate synthase
MTTVNWTEFVTQIRQGQAIGSFPTDTVPALAAAPSAAASLYAIKQRQPDKPLILMGADRDQLWDYVAGSAADREIWRSMMTAYWPGALTLVLPASPLVPAAMHPLQPGTIGLRIPNHDLARAILRHTGPLATTSANLTGEPALFDMAAIAQHFPSVLQLADAQIPAAPTSGSGTASTVIAWRNGDWQILRQGAVILPTTIRPVAPQIDTIRNND